MTTIFSFITFFSAAAGLLVGVMLGTSSYGWIGGSIGAIVGLYAGVVLGRLPGFFARRAVVRGIRAKTTGELKAILRGEDFYIFHLVIAELAVRGEDITSERKFISNLLVSENYAARLCGWKTLRYFYPKEAAQISGYEPKSPADECRAKIQNLSID